MDYLAYWSLRHKPFMGTGDAAVFFAGQPQREAIAGLGYFAASTLKSAVLMAPPGCGMTRLMKYVQQMRGLGDSATEVVLTERIASFDGAVDAALCEALGYSSVPQNPRAELARALGASGQQGIQTIWMVDRCDHVAAAAAGNLANEHDALSLVVGISTRAATPLNVVSSDCELRIDIEPLTLEDTLEYVRHCLRHAGVESGLFNDAAMVRLHELSGGILAELAALAEASLSLAANHQMDAVSPAVVEAIGQQPARAA